MALTRPAPQPASTALDAFLAHKGEFDTMLARLREISDEHFSWSPDTIDWGNVGSMAHLTRLLRQVTDAAFQEGEHA